MRRWMIGAVLLCACNVEVTGKNTGAIAHDGEPGGPCPRGVTVLLSDFFSTQIALSTLEGTTLSASFLSSASAETDGLAFALSGDVVLPRERPPSGRLVLIDRYGTNVLTWADPYSASVLGQLPVATGFESNPYDYIEISEDHAYVARFGQNGSPGRERFDEGDDVLVIDTRARAIVQRIPLRAEGDPLPARPTQFSRVGEQVLVTLARISVDFNTLGDSELVALDTGRHEVLWRVRFTGMKGCGGAVSSLDGDALFVACTGDLTPRGDVEDLTSTGIVVLDATQSPPVEVERFAADRLGGEAIQNDLAFASDRIVLYKTQTPLDGETHNRLIAWDRSSGELETLLEARPNTAGRGRGIVYGGLVCDAACSELCLLADADRRVLHRIRVDDGRARVDGGVVVETRVGLPPRGLSYR